ncbi:MAG TPA: hypothetical protein VEU62_09290, partial [Bryobacterales bacterium]|nr:hypothetical protein [Bryobacterales bacterium]
RQQRAEHFVDWMLSQPAAQRLDRLVQNLKPQLAEQFEDQYINNPPGDYEITARYTPSTPENWKGVLVSAPFRIRVIDAGDFFDVMKAKVAAGAGNRPQP